MKEQNEISEKELNKMEINNPPDAEFKTLVMRMFNEFKRIVDELSDNFKKEIENIKMETKNKREPVRNEECNV